MNEKLLNPVHLQCHFTINAISNPQIYIRKLMDDVNKANKQKKYDKIKEINKSLTLVRLSVYIHPIYT